MIEYKDGVLQYMNESVAMATTMMSRKRHHAPPPPLLHRSRSQSHFRFEHPHHTLEHVWQW